MMSTFTVPTAEIKMNPEKYLEIPTITGVPAATLRVEFKQHAREPASTTWKKANVSNSTIKAVSQTRINFVSPQIQGPGGRVQMKQRFEVQADYWLNNFLKEEP